MEKKVKVLEFKAPNGQPLFSVHMFDKEISSGKPQNKGENPSSQKKASQKGQAQGESKGNGEFMTQAQKRYLFRILAEQGKEGDEAHEYLKDLFQVDALKEVTKIEASRAIELLLKE